MIRANTTIVWAAPLYFGRKFQGYVTGSVILLGVEIPIRIGMKEARFKTMFGTPFSKDNFFIIGADNLRINHAQTFGA
jgi:hypothetical protein